MNKIEDRISSPELSIEDMRQSVLVMKDEIVFSVKENINELADARHNELEDRKRRETILLSLTLLSITLLEVVKINWQMSRILICYVLAWA